MESINWYYNRLRCMSPAEVIHRLNTKFKTVFEKSFSGGQVSKIDFHREFKGASTRLKKGIVFNKHVANDINEYAEKVVAGKLNVFIKEHDFGKCPDWNVDPKTKTKAPLIYGKTLNYRDEEVVGDIKYLWEPSRFLHLPVLARAFKDTSEEKYLNCIGNHVSSWLEQCPYLMGPHWTSSLELGIRLINWCLTWLILGEDLDKLFEKNSKLKTLWINSIGQHISFISSHYSRFSSANNHLIGEAAGLFVATSYWDFGDRFVEEQQEAQNILEIECLKQTFSDGVNKEQAISYQQFVLDFLLVSRLFGELSENPFSSSYDNVIQGMGTYLYRMRDCKGNYPMFGDADDGYVFRLNYQSEYPCYDSLINTVSHIFGSIPKVSNVDFDVKYAILTANQEDKSSQTNHEKSSDLQFKHAGYYLLESNLGSTQEIKMVMDAGPLGYGGIAAHGHADSLSLYLTVGGYEFLVDPGTYAYHTEKKWRNYFRGTSAHNTVRIGGLDQSQIGGNFMWLQKANTSVQSYSNNNTHSEILASHDGYRKSKSAIHKRHVTFDKQSRSFEICDVVQLKMQQRVEQYWHFSEQCDVKLLNGNKLLVTNHAEVIVMTLDHKLKVELFRGDESLPLGWVSRRFDHKEPCISIRATSDISGNSDLVTKIECKSGE